MPSVPDLPKQPNITFITTPSKAHLVPRESSHFEFSATINQHCFCPRAIKSVIERNMTRHSIKTYLSLAKQFRNAPTLIRSVRSGRRCDSAITWAGQTLTHPAGQPGFLDVLLEHWVFQHYIRDRLLNPLPVTSYLTSALISGFSVYKSQSYVTR